MFIMRVNTCVWPKIWHKLFNNKQDAVSLVVLSIVEVCYVYEGYVGSVLVLYI